MSARQREWQRAKYASNASWAERERARKREWQRTKRADDPEWAEAERARKREWYWTLSGFDYNRRLLRGRRHKALGRMRERDRRAAI